jgi:hypothetical protein
VIVLPVEIVPLVVLAIVPQINVVVVPIHLHRVHHQEEKKKLQVGINHHQEWYLELV